MENIIKKFENLDNKKLNKALGLAKDNRDGENKEEYRLIETVLEDVLEINYNAKNK
jgi:hypothetical protein